MDKEEFLLKDHAIAIEQATEMFPGDDVVAWLKREMYVGYAAAVAPLMYEALWGDGT